MQWFNKKIPGPINVVFKHLNRHTTWGPGVSFQFMFIQLIQLIWKSWIKSQCPIINAGHADYA